MFPEKGETMAEKEKIYIERQKNYTKQIGTFGPTGSISANGCGSIALYNILIHFGKHPDFISIVKRFNRLWFLATSFGGCMGTNILYLYHELKHAGFRVKPVFFIGKQSRSLHLDEHSALLFLYFWRKKKRLGGHYQAVFGNPDGTVTLHNPKEMYFGVEDMLKEKRRKEKMWFCMGLAVRKHLG